MLRSLVLIVFSALVLQALADLDEEWQLFKAHHSRQYEEGEEDLRRLIWHDNVKYIQRHNLEADNGKHSYWLGVNHLTDLSHEEILLRNGFRAANNSKNPVFLPPSNFDPPQDVDWRTKGYVTGVKDQGHCGSCWSFSATGSLEGQHFKKTGDLVSLSEQNLIDCSKQFGNHGCQGGLMDNAFRYIKANDGIDTEESYPYTAKNGPQCLFNKQNVAATDTGFVDIKRFSESDLKMAVASVGPVSVAIDASKKTFHFYKSGVYVDNTCSSTRLDHGVLAVGYGTSNNADYWLVKNSWGVGWGTNGYIMMARNHENMCGIATSASYPLV